MGKTLWKEFMPLIYIHIDPHDFFRRFHKRLNLLKLYSEKNVVGGEVTQNKCRDKKLRRA